MIIFRQNLNCVKGVILNPKTLFAWFCGAVHFTPWLQHYSVTDSNMNYCTFLSFKQLSLNIHFLSKCLFFGLDVDECNDPSSANTACPPGIQCINTIGSFKCECRIGLLFNADTATCGGKLTAYGHRSIQLFQLTLSDKSLKTKRLPPHPLDILTFLSSKWLAIVYLHWMDEA